MGLRATAWHWEPQTYGVREVPHPIEAPYGARGWRRGHLWVRRPTRRPIGILEVLYCVLIESPEVLNIIQENHIKSIISLLDKHGRNHKVTAPHPPPPAPHTPNPIDCHP